MEDKGRFAREDENWRGRERSRRRWTGRGMEKSFISLFMMTPVSGTTSWLPKSRLTVVVSEMAIPEASAVTMWEVPCLDGRG